MREITTQLEPGMYLISAGPRAAELQYSDLHILVLKAVGLLQLRKVVTRT